MVGVPSADNPVIRLSQAKESIFSNNDETSFDKDFAKGASIGIIVAIAIVYAYHKCSCMKNDESEDYQRAS